MTRAAHPHVAIEFPGGVVVSIHGIVDRESLSRVFAALRP
jgi:hypothetical protein